jgi:hypothetical protein
LCRRDNQQETFMRAILRFGVTLRRASETLALRRSLSRLATVAFLLAAGFGCGSNANNTFSNVAAKATPGGSDRSPAAEAASAGRDEAGREFKELPKKSDPALSPVMDDAHTGVAKRARAEREVPAGVLTAGSFDDNIYPPYFRSFLNKAGQNAFVGNIVDKLLGRRVEIFVKNGLGAPVGNAHVRIRSTAGDAKVELITRSDGRAIFLSSLDQFEMNAGLTVEATAGNGPPVSQNVDKDADRCTVILPDAAGALPRNLDLSIVLDTTGSMKDEIAFLKAEIKNIASTIRQRFPDVDVRFALVCYRDAGMGDEYVTRTFDYTSRIDEFHRNLAAQNAAGGGDIPEAMQRGLEDAVNLSWRSADTARVAFLIADAPPHRRDAEQTLAHLNTLRKKGVAIYPVYASSNYPAESEAAEVVMRAGALITGGQYLFLTDDSGVGDAHAEPHIPYYHVEKLNQLVIRMIAGELSGKRTDPDAANVIRTVGAPPNRGRQD